MQIFDERIANTIKENIHDRKLVLRWKNADFERFLEDALGIKADFYVTCDTKRVDNKETFPNGYLSGKSKDFYLVIPDLPKNYIDSEVYYEMGFQENKDMLWVVNKEISVSFNVYGDCVTRDILEQGIIRNQWTVFQYLSFINPYSLFTDPARNVREDLLPLPDNHFTNRNFCLDYQKQGLRYLFEKNSTYIILDILDSRMGLLVNENATITLSNIVLKNRDKLETIIGDGWHTESFQSIPDNQYIESVKQLCHLVLSHYTPDQVIINVHYGVEKYINNSYFLAEESQDRKKWIRSFNQLAKTLFETMISEMPGCHVIHFPDNVLGDSQNRWGWYPLHYCKEYYAYGYKALEVILQGKQDEINRLELLRLRYSNILLEKEKSLQIRKSVFDRKKNAIYTSCAKQLISHSKKNSGVLGILRKKHCKKVALGGDFVLAEYLKPFLTNNGIQVSYMISNWNNHTCDIVYKTNAEEYPVVDALIICDVINYNHWKNKFSNNFSLIFTPDELFQSAFASIKDKNN